MVGLAVPALVEPVAADDLAGGCFEGCDTAQVCPSGFAAHSLGIVAGGDAADGGGVDTDAVEAEQTRSRGGDELGEGGIEPGDLVVNGEHASAEAAHRQLRGVKHRVAVESGTQRGGPGGQRRARGGLNRSRSSSGAVKPRWRIWFKHVIRASRPERLAMSSARIASPLPSAVLATPVARPDSTARAASMASRLSDLPWARRSCRFGLSTSITSTPRLRRWRPSPTP